MNFCCSPSRACLARGPHAARRAARSSGDGAAAEAGSVPDAMPACTRAAPLLMTVQIRDPVSCSLTPLRVRIRRNAAPVLSHGDGKELCAVCQRHAETDAAAGSRTESARQRAGGCVRSCCDVLCGMEMAVRQTCHDMLLTSGCGRQLCLRGFAVRCRMMRFSTHFIEDFHDFCLELRARLLPPAHRTRGSTDEMSGDGCSMMEGPA